MISPRITTPGSGQHVNHLLLMALSTQIYREPTLPQPNEDLPYFLETDASGTAVGAAVSQKQAENACTPLPSCLQASVLLSQTTVLQTQEQFTLLF